jgi:MFS family permease
MPSRTERIVVYVAGAAQGIVLVTFPAASTVFTSPAEYGLSNTRYGLLFLPQVITAVLASVAGASLVRRVGVRRVYLWGLAAGLVSMVLLLLSVGFEGDAAAYPILLVATAFLGAGFGLTVPSLNTLTAAFNPTKVDAAILVLNALLGLGTVLAPVLVAIFVGLGFWWGLPITSSVLLAILLVVSAPLPLRTGSAEATAASRGRGGIPPRFWVFAGFAVLYGICETMNGNWAQLDMTGDLGASTTQAALALTAFWGMVTVGRIGFASVQRLIPERVVYHVLPFVLGGAFVLIASLPADRPALGIWTFGLAGLGCSALLPLTISFGQGELVAMSGAVAGGVIASYQVGYGIAAFGTGPILDNGVELSTLYAISAVVAVAMGLLSFAVARRTVSAGR